MPTDYKLLSDVTHLASFTNTSLLHSCKSCSIVAIFKIYLRGKTKCLPDHLKACSKTQIVAVSRKHISVEILLTSPRIRNRGQSHCRRLSAPGALRLNVSTVQRRNKRKGLQGSNSDYFGRDGWWKKAPLPFQKENSHRLFRANIGELRNTPKNN